MRERQERRRFRAAARAARRQIGFSAARRGVCERQEQRSDQCGTRARGTWATRAAERAARRPRETRVRGAWATRATELRTAPTRGEGACAVSERQERLNNGAAALMREANEINSGAHARQERGVRERSAAFFFPVGPI